MTPARRTTPALDYINIFFHNKENRFFRQNYTGLASLDKHDRRMASSKNYKKWVAISRIKLHGKFTDKMTIYDCYITELKQYTREGKGEHKPCLFHEFIWHTCSRKIRTIITIMGAIFNCFEILEYRLKNTC